MSLGRVLVYGGKGALGAACVSHFKANNYVSMNSFEKNRMLEKLFVLKTSFWEKMPALIYH